MSIQKRTAAATATRVWAGDLAAARRLRAHGWRVFTPEQAEELDNLLRRTPETADLRWLLAEAAIADFTPNKTKPRKD